MEIIDIQNNYIQNFSCNKLLISQQVPENTTNFGNSCQILNINE